MAIAIDQADIGGFTGQTAAAPTFNTTANVATGGFIIVLVSLYDSVETLVSVGGGGLTWSIDKASDFQGDGNQHLAIASAQAPAGLASGTTITVTFTAGVTLASCKAASFTGVATSSPVDGTPTGPTTDTETWETASYAIADGSVIVALCQLQATSTNTATAPSVELSEVALGTYTAVGEYRIEASAGSYQVAGTWGTGGTTTNIAVAYKAAGGAPPPVTDTTTRRYQIRRSRMTSW